MQNTFVSKIKVIQDEFQAALKVLSYERKLRALTLRKEAEKIKIKQIEQDIRSL
ncbi:MAG: hypothetical protein AAB664_03500 [Patescibacteria group bacterium]